jgi:pSer/pThr/pTyr-binding forkhead associated (FHA) protein
MNQPRDELFMAGCGVFGSWTLRIARPEHRDEELTFTTPSVLVGSAEDNSLCLPSRQISLRHAYLQAHHGGVFCVDLDSRTGIRVGGQPSRTGWMRPGRPLELGPYTLTLVPTPQVGWLTPPTWGHGNPLAYHPSESASFVPVVGEVSVSGQTRVRWRMNRLLAVVGRSPRCGVYIRDMSLSRFHCSLVRTPMGLWVVDLLSREGTRLNGVPIRCERLREGDELRLGKYGLRFSFQPKVSPADAPLVDDAETVAPGQAASADDNPTSPAVPAPRREPVTALVELRPAATVPAVLPDQAGPDGALMLAMVNQLNKMQQEMLDQFQERLLTATRLFASLHKEQRDVVRDELERLGGIAEELRALQADLARRGAASPAAGNRTAPLPSPAARSSPPANKPAPLPAPPPSGPPEEEVHNWLNQRISALQEEQESRWHRLLGKILGS